MTAKQLQNARSTLKLTQQELADALGVARNTVARWEMGLMPIQKSTALAMNALLAQLPD